MHSIELFGLCITAQREPDSNYVGLCIGTSWFRCFVFHYVLDVSRDTWFSYESYVGLQQHVMCKTIDVQFGKKRLIGLELMRVRS